MTINQTPASASDARKRKAEKVWTKSDSKVEGTGTNDQPPTLPDTSSWVRRAPGDVIEAGTPFVARYVDGRTCLTMDHEGDVIISKGPTYWTPPPVPREPWHDISTDRSKPTDAYVNGVPGRWWRDEDEIYYFHPDGEDRFTIFTENVTSVELLHTYSPVTQVPVDRALIEKFARWYGLVSSDYGVEWMADLAALADAAVSKDADQ